VDRVHEVRENRRLAMTIPATTGAALKDATKARLDYVDGMRALAALVVYLNHAHAQISGGDFYRLRWPWSLASYSMVAGHLSVTVFIVISGFCLTLPVISNGGELRGGVGGFLKRRARRILPPYYAAVALCLLLIWTVIGKPTGSLWDYPIRVNAAAIFNHLILIQDLFSTSLINYVFWSIAVEWHIYFVVPLLVFLWRRYGATAVVLGCLVFGYVLRFVFSDTRLTRAHPQFLGMFALGMLAAHVARSNEPRFQRLRAVVPWSALAGAALLTAVGLTLYWGIELSEARFHWLDVPVGIMTTAALAAAARPGSNVLGSIFSWPPLVAIGTFSYSFYLIHAPLLQILWQYVLLPLQLSREAMLTCLLTLGFAAVALVSYGFFRLFEAPFMRAPSAVSGAKSKPEPTARAVS
jgi:peptidoglycan/LPS O-acetylase OafA/YrhL